MNTSVYAIQAIYDKAYSHPGLMGTHLDRDYSRFTKTTLLDFCRGAPNRRLLDLGPEPERCTGRGRSLDADLTGPRRRFFWACSAPSSASVRKTETARIGLARALPLDRYPSVSARKPSERFDVAVGPHQETSLREHPSIPRDPAWRGLLGPPHGARALGS